MRLNLKDQIMKEPEPEVFLFEGTVVYLYIILVNCFFRF